MAAIKLDNKTLGTKHQEINKRVNDIVSNNEELNITNLDFKENDVDNLIKIDVASKRRDLVFIIQVLKCGDLLYISRAIKKSMWLITDSQYKNIINPEHLHKELFPEMITKARIKLLLNIRLNLKEEIRVEEFYNYIEKENVQQALKWLPHCSVPFIEQAVEKNLSNIKESLLKRLCERSFSILQICIRKRSACMNMNQTFENTNFLLKTHTDQYLDIIESMYKASSPIYIRRHFAPKFGKTTTKIVMKKCHDRIVNKFEFYSRCINIPIFAKYIEKENIKEFLLKQAETNERHSLDWINFDTLKQFINMIPIEERFEFVKEVFINNIEDSKEIVPLNPRSERIKMLNCAVRDNMPYDNTVYPWYRFAPFDTAFEELQKEIANACSLDSKYCALDVLIECANNNTKHLNKLLRCYRDRHIKDPEGHKSNFLIKILTKTKFNTYEEETWNYLNDIFDSLDIYTNSVENVQPFVEFIIIYKIIRNENAPEVIEKKFNFSSLGSYRGLLNNEEKEKVFNYLYNNHILTKTNKIPSSEKELKESIEMLQMALKFLLTWNKTLADFPFLLQKINEYLAINKQNSWNANFAYVYDINKSWKKFMFKNSLLMSPCEQVCINILKHEPMLLICFKNEFEQICTNKSVSVNILLRKVRVYFSDTLACDWLDFYKCGLNQTEVNESITRGLFALITKQEADDIIKKHTPLVAKVDWENVDEVELGIQRLFAKHMHTARPQPSPDAIIGYSKGDYLQYALPSLYAIFYNLNHANSKKYIPNLWNAPVSLQKHAIRFAFMKLTFDELKQGLSEIWKTSKNLSIRAVLFELTYRHLCREKNPSKIVEVWELLDIFIQNLSYEENKKIYELLSKVDKIPLIVRGKYLMRSYNFLKILITKLNTDAEDYKYKLKYLATYTESIMDYLDSDFVESLLLEYVDITSCSSDYDMLRVLAAYLIYGNPEENRTERYNNIMMPLVKQTLNSWNEKKDEKFYVRKNFGDMLDAMFKITKEHVFQKNLTLPVKMFSDIQKIINELPVQENYFLKLKWTLICTLIELLHKNNNTAQTTKETSMSENKEPKCVLECPIMPEDELTEPNDVWVNKILEVATEFGEKCLDYLKEDTALYFPCIYVIFARTLGSLITNISYNKGHFRILQPMLIDKDFIPAYLAVLNIISTNYYDNEEYEDFLSKIKTHPSLEVKMHFYQTHKSHRLRDTS